ncbi:hypothetical protein ACFE04_019340 [Oxalis oulophora]
MDTQEENPLLVTELGSDNSSQINKDRQFYCVDLDRVVNFNEIEKHYKDLVRSCRFWEGRVNADKLYNNYLLEKEQKFGISIAEIIAWKNDHKLNVHLKALIGLNKKRNLERKNKGKNKLPSLTQSPKEAHASEWRGQDKAILDMEEANNMADNFLNLERGELYWSHDRKRYIQTPFWHEIGAIKERRRAWLGSSNTSPDEQQMKWLMHDTIRLMCIVKEVAPKALEGVRAKIRELEEEKKIIHSQIKLADFELRKTEVEKFMRNWD